MKAILDAGPLIALWDKEDRHHAWALELFQKYQGPYFTTESVLTEVAHMTGKAAQIISAIRAGRFLFEGSLHEDAAAIERVLLAYKQADLADASIVALSERKTKLPVLTTDRNDFAFYRRADKTAIQIIAP